MGEIESFAFDVDEFAFVVYYESAIVAKIAIGPLVVVATEEVYAGALTCFLS